MNTIDLFNQYLAEIKVTYSHKTRPSELKMITCSRDAHDVATEIYKGDLEHVEYFYLIILNRANRVLGYHQLSKGGQSATTVDPKIIFQVALKCNASTIVLLHNHPSGNSKPSEADIQLTRKIKEAGNLLDLPVIDHIIITTEGYYSFADEGIL